LFPLRLTPVLHNTQAEKAAFHRLFWGEADLTTLLQEEDFIDPSHKEMFSTCVKLVEETGTCGYLEVHHALMGKGWYTATGDMAFLQGYLDQPVPNPQADEIVRCLRRARASREATKLQTIIKEAPIESIPDLLQEARESIAELLPKKAEVDRDALIAELQGETRVLETGFAKLDELLKGGLAEGTFNVLGARPGVGKTTFACNVACEMIKKGKKLLFISLEMSRRDIVEHFLCSLNGKRLEDVREDLDAALPAEITFTIHDDVFSLQGISTEVLASDHDLIIVDYLQLITHDGGDNRTAQLEEITRTLKLLARETGIPIFCLAQVNRLSEMDKNREPQLSDLRGCGAIEQDADTVAFLWDPNANGQKNEQEVAAVASAFVGGTPELKLILRKNRRGPRGYIDLCTRMETYSIWEKVV
jgi:replicative DNA helicase